MGEREGDNGGGQAILIRPIGIIHSCFKEKFGIPRQPGIAPSATARLELLSPFGRPELLRGLEQFSHIWVHFLFHQTLVEGWKASVRPPSLGGRVKVGVLASRSPHRPNHLGLSAVRLEKIDCRPHRCILELSGIDFLDGTPVIDIKPYIPYSDSIPTASAGYGVGKEALSEVRFSREAEAFCREYRERTGRNLLQLIGELIRHDPRPASQRSRPEQQFGMRLWELNIRWRVEQDGAVVEGCEEVADWVAAGSGLDEA